MQRRRTYTDETPTKYRKASYKYCSPNELVLFPTQEQDTTLFPTRNELFAYLKNMSRSVMKTYVSFVTNRTIINIYDMNKKELVHTIHVDTRVLALSFFSINVLLIATDKKLCIYNLKQRQFTTSLDVNLPTDMAVLMYKFTDIIFIECGSPKVWNTKENTVEDFPRVDNFKKLDNNRFAVVIQDNLILWSVHPLEIIKTIPLEREYAQLAYWDPERVILTHDKTLYFLNINTAIEEFQQQVENGENHESSEITYVKKLDDHRILYVHENEDEAENLVSVWNIATKQIEQEKCADVENMYSERPFVMSNNKLVYFEDNICCPGDVVVYDLETKEEAWRLQHENLSREVALAICSSK